MTKHNMRIVRVSPFFNLQVEPTLEQPLNRFIKKSKTETEREVIIIKRKKKKTHCAN